MKNFEQKISKRSGLKLQFLVRKVYTQNPRKRKTHACTCLCKFCNIVKG